MRLPPFLPLALFAILGWYSSESANGCMNEYEPNVEHRPNVAAIERSRSLLEELTEHPTTEPWSERRDRLRKALQEGGDFRVKNDLATALAHTGEATEAVALLEQVEAEQPGLYFTAANLGTAYELTGDNSRALEWIHEGIKRNPEAHAGTEWLHVRILEAKLAMAGNPKWLETHSVMEGEYRNVEGQIAGVVTGNRGERLTDEQVKKALIYQLHERLQFVPPPEAIVGMLLLDLADLVALEPVGVGGAMDVIELARRYLRALPASHSLLARAESGATRASLGQQLPVAAKNKFDWWKWTKPVVLLLATGFIASLVMPLKRRLIG